jgi:excisionase family DNA binding protein
MNKKQASEYLGVSTRQIENYTKQGRLSVRYERGTTGDVAVYDEKELRKIRADLDKRHAPRPAVVQEMEQEPSSESLAMVRGSVSEASGLPILRQLLASIANTPKASVAIADKPLLKLDEASALTGLSRGILKSAIDGKKLKARIIGRSWRIKRADLDTFVSKL